MRVRAGASLNLGLRQRLREVRIERDGGSFGSDRGRTRAFVFLSHLKRLPGPDLAHVPSEPRIKAYAGVYKCAFAANSGPNPALLWSDWFLVRFGRSSWPLVTAQLAHASPHFFRDEFLAGEHTVDIRRVVARSLACALRPPTCFSSSRSR